MMNTKPIVKLLVLFTIAVLAFSSHPMMAQGIKSQVINAPIEQRLYNGAVISSSAVNYVRPAIGQAPYEKDAELYAPPYGIEIFIDGEAVTTHRFSFNDKDGLFVGEPVHWWVFYHILEPGYFEPYTWHSLQYIYHWRDGYGWFSYDGMYYMHQQDVTWVTPELSFYVNA